MHSSNCLWQSSSGSGGGSATPSRHSRSCSSLLGHRFTIQVVEGPDDRLLHVVTGDTDAVEREANRLANEAWSCTVPSRAELVVAAISGNSQQSWRNFSRALCSAMRVVKEGGSIAICTKLDQSPGASWGRIAGAHSLDEAARQLWREDSPESGPAAQLVDALQRYRLYMLSRMSVSDLEDLELIQLANSKDLQRLCEQRDTCILLNNAQRVVPTVVKELETAHA